MKQLHNGYEYVDKKDKVWLMSLPYLKPCTNKQQMAMIFITLVTSFNGIKLGERELEFLAYMMLRKGVIEYHNKKAYSEEYGVSSDRVDNMISQLKKKKVLIKSDKQITIHPKIVIDFDTHDNFIFQFRCQSRNQ